MKKTIIAILFIALIVAFYFVEQSQAHEPIPLTTEQQEIQDLQERIGELEEELGNLKADFEYFMQEVNDDKN